MRLKQKLMLAPWITTAMLLVAVAASAGVLYHYSQTSSQQNLAATALEDALDKSQQGLGHQNQSLYRTMTIISSFAEAKIKEQRRHLVDETNRLVRQALAAAAQIDEPKVADAARTLAQAEKRFVKAADMALDMGSVDANTGVAALQTADTEYQQMSAAILTMSEATRERHNLADAALRDKAQLLTLTLGALALVTAGVALVLAWTLQRRILRDVQRVSQLAARVADGWLDRVEHDSSDDEIGELLRSQALMVEHLRDMISQVSQSADSIRTASTEVASGNIDLSQRTEEAASNLQCTASSMEQLTSNVRQSADSAAQANQLASSASGAARRGGAVMQQVVSNMQDIATSSKRIADIIGTIDGIAFQTNILALNAAIEAARAGEQGRGFAVVASEVRSLAQRSAEAAKEIKSLIGASVQKVHSGTQLVQDAGATMNEIVAGVQRVTDIIGEISAAAKEQSGGIEQVNGAVNQLEKVTQQNASLVEQSAAAAESLKEQAHKLGEAISGFRFDANDANALTAAPLLAALAPARPTAQALQAISAIDSARQRARDVATPARSPLSVAAPMAAPTATDGEWE